MPRRWNKRSLRRVVLALAAVASIVVIVVAADIGLTWVRFRPRVAALVGTAPETTAGEGGYESAFLKLLLRPESVIYTASASLTQPIFHGGALLGNLDLQKGLQDELLQTYRKAVISGFADVENALDDIRKTAEREHLQREVVASSRRAFDIAEQRLREGTVDLVTVLQTQQTLYAADDALVQAQLAHVQAIVSLYQALGGGWLPKPIEAADAR